MWWPFGRKQPEPTPPTPPVITIGGQKATLHARPAHEARLHARRERLQKSLTRATGSRHASLSAEIAVIDKTLRKLQAVADIDIASSE